MKQPDRIAIIPARFASSRFPGKPLATLRGARGAERSLLERTWLAAMAVPALDAIWIATDDERIAAEAERIGAAWVMTSPECRNGTERCAEALRNLNIVPRLIVNIQGDAPLTPPSFVDALLEAMQNPQVAVATPAIRCSPQARQMLINDRRQGRVGGTTAVMASDGRALYFSKEVLPYGGGEAGGSAPVFHHAGLYAYTPAALDAYIRTPPCALETTEGLEQLRFLDAGIRVQCVEVASQGHEFWELNNPSDISRIEAILAQQGID